MNSRPIVGVGDNSAWQEDRGGLGGMGWGEMLLILAVFLVCFVRLVGWADKMMHRNDNPKDKGK